MLGQMREQTGSLIIWVLFAIIIAAFVLFFGSPSDSLGCGSSNDYSIEVQDETVSVSSWRFAYNGFPYAYGNVPGDQRKPLALELLLQREILAQAAEKMDFIASDKVVEEGIAAGDLYLLGNKIDGTKVYFEASDDGLSFFNYEFLTNLVKGRLGLSNVATYKKEQAREMAAYMMKQEIIGSGYVSTEETRDAFIHTNTTVSLKYVKFDASRYRPAIKLSEAQVTQYVAHNEDSLKKDWEQVKPRWESEKPRVRARIIKVAKLKATPQPPASSAKDAEEKTASGVETPSSAEPGQARLAIDRAREEIIAGQSFAEVAKSTSADRTASLGGQIGWRAAKSLGYGQEVVDGIKDLEVGKVSEVIESPKAYFLVLVEERSEKGLSFEQKNFDLAVKAAPNDLANKLAKAAAQAALASASTTPLSELFPEKAPSKGFNFKDLDPEIIKQLSPEQIKQLMESASPGGKTGSIVTEGATQLASLGGIHAQVAAAEGGAEAIPSETEAAQVQAQIASVPAPSSQSIQGTTRNGDFIAGIGRSKSLVSDLFGNLGIGDLGSQVYSVTGNYESIDGYVVVQLTDRSEADMKKFEEERPALQAALARAKGGILLQRWLLSRCESLKKSGAIKVNPAMLRGSEDKQIPYEPCSLMRQTR